MRSNYKKLGPYIREIDDRNTGLKVSLLLGVSVSKAFIPSIANTIGTNMSSYKVVRRGQFAYGPVTSRNSDKISIALLSAKECIISSSYSVFEVIDPNELLPEYLMMWFRRPEFDRYARFRSHGSVRELFDWEEMCDVELPIPPIEIQREIVKEYQIIIGRLNLDNNMSQRLKETAQTIYKHYFEDCEFPISSEYAFSIGKPQLEGLPYKTSGGEMLYNDVLEKEIPKGWDDGGMADISDLIDGDRGINYPSQEALLSHGHCLFLNTGNVTINGFEFASNNFISEENDNLMRKGKLTRGDIILTTRGTVGNSAYFSNHIEYDHMRINSGMIIIRAKKQKSSPLFIYYLLKSMAMQNSIESFMSGSAQQHLPIKDLKQIPILIPKKQTIDMFVTTCERLHTSLDLVNRESRILTNISVILLKRISRI